jgi:HTH DNA binding domain
MLHKTYQWFVDARRCLETAPFGDGDDDADLLRPSWHDTPDETDADRRGVSRPRPGAGQALPSSPDTWLSGAELAGLLVPLCDATDALARLDARAAAAADAVRDGLRARMATAEAAGWLAHAHAWVHPLDLSLRAAGLTASTALAAVGRGARSLPQTFAGAAGPFATPASAAAALAPLGAGALDPARLAAWWAAHAPSAPARPRYGQRGGEGTREKMPPLLAVARAAQGWMEAGLTARPDPLHALLAAIGRCGGEGPACTVFVPVWAAYPAVGFAARDALPGLRSDAADRVAGRGRPVTWPLAFLHLVAESARMALRELDRLEAAAEQGRGVVAGGDKRSRLPDALDALLRVPALTPKALAARLKVAPQTGTALLQELQGRGVVREVTGRGSFRAFAI